MDWWRNAHRDSFTVYAWHILLRSAPFDTLGSRMSTVSSKFQITLPARIRKALRINAGDKVELRVAGDHAELRKVRPNPADVIREVSQEFDFGPLHEETGGQAVAHVRRMRWGDDEP
jgi:AbrB family looped-hinge helix DNA binding protein